MKKLNNEELRDVRQALENFKEIDIFEYVSSQEEFQKIFEETKDEEEKEKAKDFAKGISSHFTKQINEVAKSLSTEEGLQEFFKVLNERYKPNDN